MTEWGGLDLSVLDGVTDEERKRFSDFYTGRFDHVHRGLEFMLEERPDALKRFRLYVYGYEALEPARKFGFAFFVYYSLMGYQPGVRYAVRQRQRQGMTREEALDAIAISFLRTGPSGGETIARALDGYDWIVSDERMPLPEGWHHDHSVLLAGIDYSSPELSKEDLDRLRDWYLRVPGEIPPHVEFLARHDPHTLKANRGRWEHCLKALPVQSLPYTLLGFDALRMSKHGVRENTLLCKALGVSKAATVGAISAAMEYGGQDNVDVAAEAVADVFDAWEE